MAIPLDNRIEVLRFRLRGHGVMAARLTPDQKAGSSSLSALKFFVGSGTTDLIIKK